MKIDPAVIRETVGRIGAAAIIVAILFYAGVQWEREHFRRNHKANRYSMQLTRLGEVLRLDKQTGQIHYNGTWAGDLPEVWPLPRKPMSALEFLDAPDTPTSAPLTPTFADSQPSR